MSTHLLDMHLQLLVLEHGRTKVVQSLARISEVSEASIEAQLAAAAKVKAAKSSKVLRTPDELLNRIELPPAKREILASLAREFENKRFLGELRLVEKFFREHQVKTRPKSRISALPKVLSILAALPETDLSELLNDCANKSAGSDFSHLAGAIMGKK
jgi:hypothetical protein